MKVVNIETNYIPTKWYNTPVESHSWKINDRPFVFDQSFDWCIFLRFQVSYFLFKQIFFNEFKFWKFNSITSCNPLKCLLSTGKILSVMQISWAFWNKNEKNGHNEWMNYIWNNSRLSILEEEKQDWYRHINTVVKNLSKHIISFS